MQATERQASHGSTIRLNGTLFQRAISTIFLLPIPVFSAKSTQRMSAPNGDLALPNRRDYV
jgi:hypothetical protein